VRGVDNYLAVASHGAILTANHFSVYDNYAIYKAIAPYLEGRDLYKVIREGNYTSYGGRYGFFFRHCNTLPFPSDRKVYREFSDALPVLINRGEKILIYPEQAMWWNYRKPRPLKKDPFLMAAKNNAPVIPFFITMRDTETIGGDGFPIQGYTVHILPAIYPDKEKNPRENAEIMRNKNFDVWKELYESVYGEELSY
jgi:hypothetical protein